MIQDPSQAFSFQNYARGDGSSTPPKGSVSSGKDMPSGIYSFDGEIKVDNKSIADKIIPTVNHSFEISFSSGEKQKKIRILPNRIFKVILDEPEGSRWVIDCDKKVAKQLSSQLLKNKRILEFQSQSSGLGIIYFDNITETQLIKSLASKLLRVRIENE